MHIGIFAALTNPMATPEYVTRLARAAEERDFHSIWLAEHALLFDEYSSRYPYSEDGRIPTPRGTGTLELHVSLGYLAAVTSRIRLATGICLVPQRNPVYTAKEIATLDWLSGGRVDFGVGVGWLREEFEALGIPFERRGARTREAIELIQRLWTDEVSEYQGEFYRLPPCLQFPKPVQDPYPPIYFGGDSDAALRRVATLGQGWYPIGLAPETLASRLGDLETLLAEQGRRRADVQVTLGSYPQPLDLDLVKRYRDAGADQVTSLVLGMDPDDLEARLDTLHREVVEPARNL